MTDQDELRDRIKQSMIDALSRNYGGGTYDDAAQAVIDDLGLTVETHAATHAKRTMTRITGAWEWEKQ